MGIVVVCIVALFSSSTSLFDKLLHKTPTPTPTTTPVPTVTVTPTPSPTPEPDLTASAVITSVGDIILHQAVIDGGLQADGTYQYDYLFKYISSYFNDSDYSIANYEGALNGPPYSGYPMFNGPDAIASAIKNAGIDMVTTANNHSFDRGVAGMIRTPQVFSEQGVKVIGTRSSAADTSFHIIDMNGIKIGITGYTYETPGTETDKALNGMILPPEAAGLVDSFNPYRAALYTQDKAEMAQRVQAMKDAGAECILFVLHWGEEYKTFSDSTQQQLAQFLADQGVDVIFGHHPHVLQEISVLSSAVSGKETLVYYSIGNFLANMNFGTQGTNGYAEDAVIARVTVERSKDGVVRVSKGEYIDTYVYKEYINGIRIHTIIPVEAALASPEAYGMTGHTDLLASSAARTAAVMATNKVTPGSILVQEYKP
jgi:poly-gamma-glutamate synthesis protein (capsule biosynthesis protein)